MGTEDRVFEGTKLITNTKKQRLKIQSRGWIFKNTILKEAAGKKKKEKKKKKKKKATIIIKKTPTTTT